MGDEKGTDQNWCHQNLPPPTLALTAPAAFNTLAGRTIGRPIRLSSVDSHYDFIEIFRFEALNLSSAKRIAT